MKKVLLIGIYGTYNYGCEAIVRGTVNILKNVNPNIEVFYASMRGKDDRKRLAGCDITIIDRPPKKKWTIHNVVRKLLSLIGVNYIVPYDTFNWLGDIDTVFSIGGDLYTLNPDNSFDQSLPKYLVRCQKKGLKYVLWGASVGKFENNPKALCFFKSHLPKIDMIFTREPNTKEYLKSLGVENNVVLAPDPAFFVRNNCKNSVDNCDKNCIGINLSPLSALYEYGNLDIAIERQSYAIIKILQKSNYEIVLIPHVISYQSSDNDLDYLKMIYSKVNSQYPTRISIVENDPGFEGLTECLMGCKAVIAARMHCAVNAISAGTPAIFLSYSEKAKGMSQYIYGDSSCCIKLSEFENIELVLDKIENLPIINERYKTFDFKYFLNF